MTTSGVGVGAADFTVSIAAADAVPRPVAVISVVPSETPVANPCLSIVATDVLLDCQDKITPLTSLFAESKALAVNCCFALVPIVADEGETSMRAIGGQAVNGAPLTRVPGLKSLAPAPTADWCKTKLPETSGDRVSDWLAFPFNPVEPP